NIKNDFPILKTKFNGKPLIFLDNAATSQKPQSVIDTVKEFYESYNSNIHRGIYHIAEKATEKYGETRKIVANFINAKNNSEIIFTSGTTEAINLVAFSWGNQNLRKGDNIITTISEHHSNFVPWQQLAKRKKAQFLVSPVTKEGAIDQTSLIKLISKKTKLVAIPFASNVLGNIHPVRTIIQKIKNKNPKVRVLIDGAQAAPHLKINVRSIDCDFFAFSGHKMLGPSGTGVLYARQEILESMPPFITGGHMIKNVDTQKATFNDLPWKFEAGTQNVAGVIGLGAAINYLNRISMKKVRKYLEDLTEYALAQLNTIPGITIYGIANPKKRVSTFAFNIKGVHSHDLAQVLGDNNICIRAGHHCAIPLHHFLGITDSARASFYIYNTKQEVDELKIRIVQAKKLIAG
ncbi:MAG: Cysteine desulfurase, partial [Parcubacteria group bacterium GW2011_GWC1_38_6]